MPAPLNIARHSSLAPAVARVDLRTTTAEEDVFYPCSDGKPMADNMWQARAIINAASDLEAALPDALVAADILMYPERGNNENRIAPDVLVAFGLGTHNRSSYFVWREGKPPDWVLEVASPGTSRKDLNEKWHAYAAIGVPEYWLFDPQGGLFPRGQARLQGFRLAAGTYWPLVPAIRHGVTAIHSEVLDLDLRADGELLRFRYPATGEDIPHRDESDAATKREAARAEREAARADKEATRAKQEATRADSEAAKRKAAQARVAELEAAFERARAGSPSKAP